jgi:2-polyprenyl-3-methyl-5-hydroxy-6-metoxy-1,4-benzoquinol methylase
MKSAIRSLFRKTICALKASYEPAVLSSCGTCPICRNQVRFVAHDPWLRDHFICPSCRSIPRERALMAVIDRLFPNWPALSIHESSPGGRGASVRIASEANGYIPSQYFPGESPGSVIRGYRNENLEALTFDDASLDLHITQDVMEHVFDASQVFREIARTLRPGGAHVFTVPIVLEGHSSRRRAERLPDGSINHLLPAQYHGNPVDDQGSLVTIDWGDDICQAIAHATGMTTEVYVIDDLSRGIRAKYIEVFVSRKPKDLRSDIIHD